MSLLAGADAVILARPAPSTRTDALVVGGGLAGLHAARMLLRNGVDVLLVEARDRLGGRILTVDGAGVPAEDGFDLGPSWFWPQMQPGLAALVAELGLAAFPQNGAGDLLFEQKPGAPPRRFSDVGADQPSMRLVGGTAALVRGLAGGLPRDRVLLGTTVTTMSLAGDDIELTATDADGRSRMLGARHVVVAVPPRVLAATVAFSPEQEAATVRRWRTTPTWMAPHAKFLALYDRSFWAEAGLSGAARSLVGPMGEIHDASTASGRAGLFGFVGVSAAQRARLGRETLVAACLAQLGRLFGPDAAAPRATLLKDWAADPLTATATDQVAGDHPIPSDAPWVSGPWQDRLVLAASETSPSEPGYLAGAVLAAERAANRILSQ